MSSEILLMRIIVCLLSFLQRSTQFERRSRDLRERELHYSERNTPRMHYGGETLGPQRYEGLSSTGEL